MVIPRQSVPGTSTKIVIPTSSPEATSHYPQRPRRKLTLPPESSEEEDDQDDDYADLEHDFDENEEALLQRLETIGDSGRSKHKTFEGIPRQWH